MLYQHRKNKHTLSYGAGWKLNSGVLLKEADSWRNCWTFLSLVTWQHNNQSLLTMNNKNLYPILCNITVEFVRNIWSFLSDVSCHLLCLFSPTCRWTTTQCFLFSWTSNKFVQHTFTNSKGSNSAGILLRLHVPSDMYCSICVCMCVFLSVNFLLNYHPYNRTGEPPYLINTSTTLSLVFCNSVYLYHDYSVSFPPIFWPPCLSPYLCSLHYVL